MDNDALVLVYTRNEMYQQRYRLVLAANVLTFIINCWLFILIIYLSRTPTQPCFFATDSVARIIQQVPLNRPNMPVSDVLKWTIEGIESAYSYNFVNFRQQLQDSQAYFTQYGWREFMKGLKQSNNLVTLAQRKWVFIAAAAGEAKILNQGIAGGRYAWQFQIPILMTYLQPPDYGDQTKTQNALTVTVIVQRQKPLESTNGLGINQLNADFTKTPTTPQNMMGSP